MVYYFLSITLKNILSLVFFILNILQHFKLVSSWFRFLMSQTGYLYPPLKTYKPTLNNSETEKNNKEKIDSMICSFESIGQ